MLEKREDRFYMTTGYATKYEVSENDTIQLVAPERKNITVAEVKNATAVSQQRDQENNNSVTDEDMEVPWNAPITDFFEGIYNFFKNL